MSRVLQHELVHRLRGSRVSRGVVANLYSQLVTVAVQLLALPLFLHQWGAHTYGTWLLLFTIPSYLALSDFGFATAAGNEMIQSIARGDQKAAVATYQGTRLVIWAITLALFSIIAGVLFLSPVGSARIFSVPDVRTTVLLLAAYGLVTLHNSLSMAGFRSIGLYASGTSLLVTILLFENLAALIVVFLGGDMPVTAGTYLVTRLVGSVALASFLHLRAPWIRRSEWDRTRAAVRKILHPALAVMALPAAQAAFLQGTVITVGAAIGPEAVPMFVAGRTFSRLAIQLITSVNHAVMPEFTVAVALADRERKMKFVAITIITSLLFLVPMFLIANVFGRPIIFAWSGGKIEEPYGFIFAMSLMMVLNGIWHPISNLILASNRHGQYSYTYLLAALASVCLSYPLAAMFGIAGAASSLVLLDLFMLIWVFRKASQLGVVT